MAEATTTFNCDECEKTFSNKKNLSRHTRHVHEKLKPHQCGICFKSFSRKQNHDYHLRSCSRNISAPSEQVEKITKKETHELRFTPIKRSSGFGGLITEWCIYYPEEYRFCDHITLLESSALAMKDIIQKQLYEKTLKLKYTMNIHIVLTKPTDPEVKTEPPVVLWTDPRIVYVATDLEGYLIDDAKELYNKIAEYEGIGSGWVIDYLVRLDTGIYSF